jgi:enoyl-CoA hydratase
MEYSMFDVSIAEHIATVTLNRPEQRNTMPLLFWPQIRHLFTALNEQPEVRVVVLGSELSAGDRGRSSERLRRLILTMQESFTAIERCRVPVLAAIQGACIGGGVDMISACDMRYCTADAFFCIHEINIGMTADVGTLQRLPRLIPDGVARELAYTGRRLLAPRAQEVGLVNAVYPNHETMLAEVMTTAREIAQRSPLAVVGTKQMLNYTRDHSIADGLNYVATWNAGMFLTGDVMEQMAANLEKRPAQFPDLLPERRLDEEPPK